MSIKDTRHELFWIRAAWTSTIPGALRLEIRGFERRAPRPASSGTRRLSAGQPGRRSRPDQQRTAPLRQPLRGADRVEEAPRREHDDRATAARDDIAHLVRP